MSTSHRICETCVYCSLAGNCDRYDKPLTSIEQPACDAYEVHPLLDENAKLRELVRDMFRDFANADNELKRDQGRTFMAVTRYAPRMRELGVEP